METRKTPRKTTSKRPNIKKSPPSPTIVKLKSPFNNTYLNFNVPLSIIPPDSKSKGKNPKPSELKYELIEAIRLVGTAVPDLNKALTSNVLPSAEKMKENNNYTQ